jgi:hypothetical protein
VADDPKTTPLGAAIARGVEAGLVTALRPAMEDLWIKGRQEGIRAVLRRAEYMGWPELLEWMRKEVGQ